MYVRIMWYYCWNEVNEYLFFVKLIRMKIKLRDRLLDVYKVSYNSNIYFYVKYGC